MGRVNFIYDFKLLSGVMNLQVTYDREVDAVYLNFIYPKVTKVSYTVEASHNIFMDYDSLDKLIGIEILNAKSLIGAPDSVKFLEYVDLWED